MLANMDTFDEKDMFAKMDQDSDGVLSREELRSGVRKHFGIRLRQTELDSFGDVTLANFTDVLGECLRKCGLEQLELNYRPISF
jgi:Ca2+-binding EF-hand superfamily protein